MPNSRRPWTIVGFLERLDAWVKLEDPPEHIRRRVTAWIMTRIDDPYQGDFRREPDFENLWFGEVPGTDHGDGRVVVCSFWIEERIHTVRCDNFGTLPRPI